MGETIYVSDIDYCRWDSNPARSWNQLKQKNINQKNESALDRLEKDVNNHHKHYHGLILWLKSHAGHALIDQNDPDCEEHHVISGNYFDLCHILSEGSTVAHAIWNKYEAGWSPENKKPVQLPTTGNKRFEDSPKCSRCNDTGVLQKPNPYAGEACVFCSEK